MAVIATTASEKNTVSTRSIIVRFVARKLPGNSSGEPLLVPYALRVLQPYSPFALPLSAGGSGIMQCTRQLHSYLTLDLRRVV